MYIKDIRIGFAPDIPTIDIVWKNKEEQANPLCYLSHSNRQNIKVLGIKNQRQFDSIKFEHKYMSEFGGATMDSIEMTYDDDGFLMQPIINKFSFNPNIILSKTNGLLPFDYSMIFVTIDTDNFCQLRYYTNMDVMSVFQSKKNHQIGCILRYIEDDSDDDKYFSTYGVEKETGRFREYHYSTKDHELNTTDKFNRQRLSELQEINKKYHNRPLNFKYATRQIPAHVIVRESDVDGLIDDINEFYDGVLNLDPKNDLVLHKIPDDFDIHDDAVLAGLLGDSLARTKAVLLGPGIELTRDRAYALNLIYLLQFDRNRNGDIILRQVQGK